MSISTSETARVERLRLTRKQLAALARYTLLHLSNHQSTVLNTQLEFSLLFKEALPCFELLIFSSAHTDAEKHYLFRIFKSKAKLHLCRSVINSLLTFTPHKVRLMSRITPRHLPYLKSLIEFPLTYFIIPCHTFIRFIWTNITELNSIAR